MKTITHWCWKLFRDKKGQEPIATIHNIEHDANDPIFKKKKGIVTYYEPYNNVTIDYEIVKKAISIMCRDIKCPLGEELVKEEQENEKRMRAEDLAAKEKLKKERHETHCVLCEKELRSFHRLYFREMTGGEYIDLCEECYWNMRKELAIMREDVMRSVLRLKEKSSEPWTFPLKRKSILIDLSLEDTKLR